MTRNPAAPPLAGMAKPAKPEDEKAERERRLSQALRDNLKRRKAGERGKPAETER